MTTAREVLHTATPATDRTLLAWAAGAYWVTHCLNLSWYRRSRDPRVLGTEAAGGAGDGFEWWINTRAFDGLVRASGHRFQVRWREVAAVLDRAVDDAELADEQDRLLRQRRELTGEDERLFRRWQLRDLTSPTRDERDEFNERWSDVERRCRDSAARTWTACYPQQQQLALFA